MALFREVLEDHHLSDLGYSGSKFTWSNCRQDAGFTKEQLDRVVANTGWCTLFKRVEVYILAARDSDHKPVLIKCTDTEGDFISTKRGAKFEAKWLLDSEASDIIANAWNDGSVGGSLIQTVQQRLEKCKGDLRRWSWQKYGNIEKAIRDKTKQLEIL